VARTETDLDSFLESPEAAALADVPADARREVAKRLHAALREIGTPLDKIGASDVHGWLLHCVPDEFQRRDPLAKHVAPVLGALVDFTERTSGRKLGTLRKEIEEALPDLEDALVSGHSHHDHGEHAPETPYVRETPKVGRNDPCPCGSGKKFKKCHGS
jgi:hypothetical protein